MPPPPPPPPSWPGRGSLSVAAVGLLLLLSWSPGINSHRNLEGKLLNGLPSPSDTENSNSLGKGVSRGNKLKMMLQRREAPVPVKAEVSVKEDKAKEFLRTLKRQKRQLWDRSQPDVQQWYQQFLYLGFDEAKFEDDVSYWSNLGRSGHEYYGGYYHHHYDEDAPIGPRNPHTFRHGASVNYDDY